MMRAAARGSRHVLTGVVAATLLLAGCSTAPAPPARFAVPAVAAAPAAAGPVPVAEACTPGYSEIGLQPETQDEQWLAPSLRACARFDGVAADGTNRYSLEVVNAGPAVWVVDGVAGWDEAAMTPWSPRLFAFRQATRGRGAGLAVEPGTRAPIPVPGTFVLSLHLDPALQASWLFVDRGVQAAGSGLRAQLDRRAPRVGALATCAASAYDVGTGLTTGTDVDVVESLFSTAAGAEECRSALAEAAEREQRAAAQARRIPPRAVQQADLMLTAAERPVVQGWSNVLRTAAQRAPKVLQALLR